MTVWVCHRGEQRNGSTESVKDTYTTARHCSVRAGGALDARGYVCFAEWKLAEVDVPAGTPVMQAALNHRIEGILGECGGNCMCATCHVYVVDAEYFARIPSPVGNEKFMLSIAAEGPASKSRLTCQIKMTEELNGLSVRVPGKQKCTVERSA